MRMADMPMIRSVTGGHRVMWRVGRAVEKHIREQYIAGRQHQDIFGNWSCRCGAATHTGFYPTRQCNLCETRLYIYDEFPLFDREARIVGNPDLLTRFEGEYVVVEIKSMTKSQWDALTEPLADHIFQASWYRWLMANLGYPTRKEVVFVYCTKEFKFGVPYKEFHVDVTTPGRVNLILDLRAQVMDLNAHMEAGTVPVREICATPTCTTAKNCPVSATCWSLSQ